MEYIYHLRPEPMVGHELIPLNQMESDGHLYKTHAKKYVGRESLMNEVIPLLNCKWNDVVQFSALDPQVIVDELKRLEPDLKLLRTQYYKVHIDQIINIYDSVIFDRKVPRMKNDFTIDDSEVFTLDRNYKELHSVPLATINCWEKAKKEGGKLLWFPFIPHILVKGRIDTSDFEVCNLTI